MGDSSAVLKTCATVRDIDGGQPSLPVGVFNTLVAEFCSTLMAQARQLDKMIDDANQAQHHDVQLVSKGGPRALCQESATHARVVDPADMFVEVMEDGELHKECQEASKESQDGNDVQRGTTTKSLQKFRNQSRHTVLPHKEARAVIGYLSVSCHLADKQEDTDILKSKPAHHLFADLEAMKEHIRHSILKPYSVSQYYYDDGICRDIADNNIFELTTLCVICMSAIWIAIDVDANGAKPDKEKHAFFQIVEWSFFLYFLGEILIRFGAFYSKLNCFRDFWFVFDSSLAILMCVDALLPLVFDKGVGFNASFLRLARLVKLARMARIARILHKYPELNLLLRGIGLGFRSVLSSFMLLAVLVYLFAVAFRYLTIDTVVGDMYFRTVPLSMKYLVLTATMPDAMEMVNSLADEQVLNGLLFVVYITLSALTIMNMLIAILCEVIHSAAVLEKETCKVQLVKDHLCNVLDDSGFSHHTDDDMIITKAEFQQLLLNASVVNVLRKVGVDAAGLIDFVEYIFGDDSDDDSDGLRPQGLTFEKLVELICALGGDNAATVKDVVDMRQVVMRQILVMEESLDKQLHDLQASVSKLAHARRVEKNATSESHRMPLQALSPGDVNAFLQMAVSTWVDCVKSQRSSTGTEDTSNCPLLSMEKLIEEKVCDAEKLLRSKFENANDSRIADVLVLVKDLQARLDQCQKDLRHSKVQLSSFENRTETAETRLRSATHDVHMQKSSAAAQPPTLTELLDRELNARNFSPRS